MTTMTKELLDEKTREVRAEYQPIFDAIDADEKKSKEERDEQIERLNEQQQSLRNDIRAMQRAIEDIDKQKSAIVEIYEREAKINRTKVSVTTKRMKAKINRLMAEAEGENWYND